MSLWIHIQNMAMFRLLANSSSFSLQNSPRFQASSLIPCNHSGPGHHSSAGFMNSPVTAAPNSSHASVDFSQHRSWHDPVKISLATSLPSLAPSSDFPLTQSDRAPAVNLPCSVTNPSFSHASLSYCTPDAFLLLQPCWPSCCSSDTFFHFRVFMFASPWSGLFCSFRSIYYPVAFSLGFTKNSLSMMVNLYRQHNWLERHQGY